MRVFAHSARHLDGTRNWPHLHPMSVALKVNKPLVMALPAKKLTPDRLGEIADRLDAADPSERVRLEEEFVAGFYGKRLKRANAKNPKS